MLFLQQRSHPDILPLVECTVVGLPLPNNKMLSGELCLLEVIWDFAFCIAKIEQTIAVIICIILVLTKLW